MAGIEFDVNKESIVELRKFQKEKLALLMKKVGDQSQPLKESVLIVWRDIMDHFRDESGPEGKWTPLNPKTLARRRQGKGRFSAKILQDTGRLRQSVVTELSQNQGKVGTNMDYARTHQKGDSSRNIPQREFIWVSRQAADQLFKRFIKWNSID